MPLYIQDPQAPDTPFLHESILEKCKEAIRGGGAFAFVTKEGVELLLRDTIFTKFLASHPFELVVGIDEITNVKALEALSILDEEFIRLTAKVFYHEQPKTTFHPKFCWFRHRTGGFLIVGSGNLTRKGLRGNWEAYTVTELLPAEIDAVEKQWLDWTNFHSSRMKSTKDDQVLLRAALNVWRRQITEAQNKTPQDLEELNEADKLNLDVPQQLDAVLIAELSKSGGRWKQANFHLEVFQSFFEVNEGAVRRITMQHVNDDGVAAELESRPSVPVKSRNFRFEIGAATGLEYPAQGRPVVVFVRTAARTFIYRLLMPSDSHYRTVETFLASKWNGRANHMRQVITDVGSLQQAWPDAPLWQVQIDPDG